MIKLVGYQVWVEAPTVEQSGDQRVTGLILNLCSPCLEITSKVLDPKWPLIACH